MQARNCPRNVHELRATGSNLTKLDWTSSVEWCNKSLRIWTYWNLKQVQSYFCKTFIHRFDSDRRLQFPANLACRWLSYFRRDNSLTKINFIIFTVFRVVTRKKVWYYAESVLLYLHCLTHRVFYLSWFPSTLALRTGSIPASGRPQIHVIPCPVVAYRSELAVYGPKTGSSHSTKRFRDCWPNAKLPFVRLANSHFSYLFTIGSCFCSGWYFKRNS